MKTGEPEDRMDSQKLEDILNLSLDSTMEEREKSQRLNVGFNEEEQTWELIVKFHGDLSRLNNGRISVEVLLPAAMAATAVPCPETSALGTSKKPSVSPSAMAASMFSLVNSTPMANPSGG